MKRVILAGYTGDPDPTGKLEGKIRFLNKFKSWRDVYDKFIEIANECDDEDEIDEAVYQFYLKGEGDKNFETAYSKWLDDSEA